MTYIDGGNEVAMKHTRALLWITALAAGPIAACGASGEATSDKQQYDDGGTVTSSGAGGATMSSSATDSSADTGVTVSGSGGGPSLGCNANGDCPPGTVCVDGDCVEGCADDQPCEAGKSCCTDTCFDLTTDMNNCGACDQVCPTPPNIAASCENGMCTVGDCDMGFFDCDGDPSNGCEQPMACSCTPGNMQSCYPGPPGTENIGECKSGSQTCSKDGTAWSLCSGWVIPAPEICANSKDEDCNGQTDDSPDLDQDGWTVCDGDCCDKMGQACGDPKLVNPGAFEFVGNMVDDDCDPATSDSVPAAACSSNATFSNVTADKLAEAIDICQKTTANAPLPQKKWGLLSAEFKLANGTTPNATELSNMKNWQAAVLTDFGTGGVVPKVGSTMAGISSGRMRDQSDPSWTAPTQGGDFGSYSTPPAAYLAAHNNSLPASASCNGVCPAGSGANDSINLRVQLRVPTNALSFAYRFRFFSAEYWTYACTTFNDFYLALLTSTAQNIPADKNISFDSQNNPVSVNNGFFDVCTPKGCYMCPDGPAELAGTGFQLNNYGGATKWLKTTAPITPGETMTLELMIFDVTDNLWDSLALLDGFEWNITASAVGTNPEN